jgi:nitrogen fixation protein FixH
MTDVISSTESIEMLEKRAKRFWIALVVLLFIVQSTIMGLVMHLAIGDPAAAVVPDYHRAALNWDQTRRELEAAGRLGWSIQFAASDIADDRGMRALQMQITDQAGDPIDSLEITGKLYHHADADRVEPVKLNSVGQGNYLSLAPAQRPGIWQLELKLEGGPEPMAHSLTFVVED